MIKLSLFPILRVPEYDVKCKSILSVKAQQMSYVSFKTKTEWLFSEIQSEYHLID